MTTQTRAAHERAETLAALARTFLREPECRSDWHDFYRAFRGVPPLPIGNDDWIATRWEDVHDVMRHSGAGLASPYPTTDNPALNRLLLGILPTESGATHRRLRSLTQSSLTSTALAGMKRTVRAAIDDFLYPAVFASEGCDVRGTLGIRIPEILSCLLLDVEPDDRPAVIGWSRLLYSHIGRYDHPSGEQGETTRQADALRDYVLHRASQHREGRGNGVSSRLFAAHHSGNLNDDQLVSYFALFLLAGQDTVTFALTNATWFLGSAPKVLRLLQGQSNLAGEAFGEAMRLWGPIRLCVRTLSTPLARGAWAIPAGARVFAMIHAANRDPDRHNHPDEFRWGRPKTENLAYGVGPHSCLGGALGALVGTALFESLSERCERVSAIPGVGDARFVPLLPILGVDKVRLFAASAA